MGISGTRRAFSSIHRQNKCRARRSGRLEQKGVVDVSVPVCVCGGFPFFVEGERRVSGSGRSGLGRARVAWLKEMEELGELGGMWLLRLVVAE